MFDFRNRGLALALDVSRNGETLKAKWLWRFANEKDAMWTKVIVTKCGWQFWLVEWEDLLCSWSGLLEIRY